MASSDPPSRRWRGEFLFRTGDGMRGESRIVVRYIFGLSRLVGERVQAEEACYADAGAEQDDDALSINQSGNAE